MSGTRDVARTLGTLGLLTAVLPVNAAVTGAALVAGRLRPAPARRLAGHRRTVLVSGGMLT